MLDREGIDAVHADYWIAYRLAFETDERIIALAVGRGAALPALRR